MSEGASASGAGAPTPAAAPEAQVQPSAAKEKIQSPTVAERGAGERLPGVMEPGIGDETELQAAEELFGADEEGGKGDRKARLRGPDGRFVAQAGEQGEAAVELPEGAEPEVEPGAETPKFKFAGEEWENQEKAEQNFKTLRGMHKAQEAKVAAEAKRANENWAAYEAWKKYAEGQQARITELESGRRPEGQPEHRPSGVGATGEFKVEDVVKGIDWDAYNYVSTKGSLAKGGEYLIGEVMRIVQEQMLPSAINKLRAEMQEQIQPFAQDRHEAETINAMTQAHQQLVSLKTADGRVAFPELGNEAEVEQIGYYWAREAADEADAARRLNLLRTPAGLMQAIALYRMVKSLEEAPAATPQPGNGKVTSALPAEPLAPGPAATLSVRGDEGFHPGTRSDLSPMLSRLVSEMSKGDMIDNDLGFARNR